MRNFLLLLSFLTLVLVGCKKEEGCTDDLALNYDPTAEVDDNSCLYANEDEVVVINGVSYSKISGDITEDKTLTNDTKWLLSGGVFVQSGVTLTIKEGTKIYGDNSVTSFLSILQGGKISAIGTKDEPIVFTSIESNPQAGDWGGIIVNGYATINNGSTSQGEGGTGVYGGTDDNDNSGVIKYVRVEYAGKILGTDNELNGFSFNGVGRGTTVEYIEAFNGADDGIEFFGGTVNVRYAVSIGNKDDSFDWTHGWRGYGQYWYVDQQGTGDRGIEADNNGDNNALTPYSNPVLQNVTIIGANDDGDNIGVVLREGTKGKIYNISISNFPKYGAQVRGDESTKHMNNNELFLSNVSMSNNGQDYENCDFSNTNLTNNNSSWFISDNTIGSGKSWMQGWTIE
jgi:hypothetical protein